MSKKSRLIAEYNRERNRIMSQVRKMKKSGFDVSEIKIPKTAAQMSRVTEGSVRRLKKMTTRSLQEKSTRVDYETGEVITARQAKVRAARERGEARRKPKTTPVVETKKEKPAPTPSISEWEILTDDIYELLQRIPFCEYYAFSKKCYDIMSHGFDDFLRSVEYASAEDKKDAISILRSIKSDGILNQDHFDSDDVELAKSWATNVILFGERIKSQDIVNMGNDMLNIESVSSAENPVDDNSDEEFYTPDPETLKNNPWIQTTLSQL